jgi:YVTN family beta-propeller protein
MENQDRILRVIVLIILNITGLALMAEVLNFTYAMALVGIELHQKTLFEIMKYTPKENASINVGPSPSAIGVDEDTNTIYVANFDANTVSVIDGDNNTRIGKDIPVGKYPSAIGVNSDTDKIYVANFGDNTVSVIDGQHNKLSIPFFINI